LLTSPRITAFRQYISVFQKINQYFKRNMKKEIIVTLDNEILDFVDQLAINRSSFINEILWKEKKRIFMQELENAYREQDRDADFQEEFAVWDITVGDSLDA